MATIYVKNIPAFDAANDYIISFGYAGVQCTKNKIVVYNSVNHSTVYDNTVTTYTLSHTIPANTLTNGVTYYCIITAYYTVSSVEYSVTSSSSNVFKCLTTPTWGITGLTEGSVIGNSYYTFTPAYSQAEGETVDEYYIVLYTSSGTIYWESGALYDIATTTTVSNLPNDSVYKVRIYGTTVNGFILDSRDATTGLDFSVSVQYTVPSIYSLAYLENSKWNGWVKVTTNITGVEGIAHGITGYFVNNGANLTTDGSYVTFESGFELNNDFTIEMTLWNFNENIPFFRITGDGLNLVFTLCKGTFEAGELLYATLKESNSNYFLCSNMITMSYFADRIYVFIQRKNGLYDLKIVDKGV